ncbi:translation initiation factor IF-2 [Sinimarinibacterium sp. CAU 1509]|uniref:translation initiation factor IF-2 n=1 Tax=Sinimarinibacterium sp. CAU 1509 TaxID=2562283 RepID=UPI0010AB61FC|nr:translation initiation factor IF-2 [Sinimarinibacterium sp. CAU 1509]TJY62175.1 translation initiation factor IF-2 [Sinimarinibacterium sp. CAU 1509]
MSTVTVQDFAKELGRPIDELLTQFKEAGVTVSGASAPISGEDKVALLNYLQLKTGGAAPASGEPKRITLKRRETTELKLGGARGAPSKTVSIEVRKKRTYVKRDEMPELDAEAQRLAEEAAIQAEAERAAAARLAAEAEALRQQQEAERKQRDEEEQRKRDEAAAAERQAKDEHARLLQEDPLYRAKWEAEQSRSRAAENIRRAAEAARIAATQPAPVIAAPAPVPSAKKAGGGGNAAPAGRAAPGGGRQRTELHLADGKKGARREKKSKKPSGRVRFDNVHVFEKPVAPVVREVEVPEAITVGELANRMAVKATELIKVMMKNGLMATINQTLDQDTALLMVEEMGHKARSVKASDFEDSLEQAVTGGDQQDIEKEPRPAVVTIMGHVDHGKTSLLDYIRKTKVASGEAGGITQHIGAYHVETDKGIITFLDTPGHAAFTRMRARGAQVTDIVVLVVASDDGVMPQTREAIQHARAAGAPIVVAVTKIDKPDSDIDRVKTELSKENVIAEEWGGDVQIVGVSAVTGQGVDALLDALLVQAEMLELTAPVESLARGNILEASIEKGRGPVATVLVRAGTLKQGDVVLSGPHFGRVRAMFDETGKPTKEAGPSIPVQILGLSGAPDAGDDVVVVADERSARELAELREQKLREQKLAQSHALRMDQVFARMGEGDVKQLNLMIKSDVQGSAEAISDALRKIPSEEVRVNVLTSGIGGISESDVDLAAASKAIIIGFNVRADAAARKRIQDTGVDVRYYSIIYDIIDDVSSAVSGLLGTETREQIVGIAQVRDVFRSSTLGSIAGCLVIEGSVQKSLPIRVLRNNTVIYEGVLESLRRFKDDVQKVEAGTECGIGVKDYNDVKAGDQIECFQRVEVRRTVSAAA